MRANQKATRLHIVRIAAASVATAVVAGCGGNSASPPGATTVVPPSSAKVQVAVGTANLFGLATGLNVTSTLRTPDGHSVLLNTPKLTGPFTLPSTAGTANAGSSILDSGQAATIDSGPSAAEIASGGVISGTPQVLPGTPTANIAQTTFGIRGGVFAGGFQPSNADNIGSAFTAPYRQPSYDPLYPTDPNSFFPLGGPPAFDPNKNGQGARDGTFDPSIPGFNEFITTFQGVIVAPGVYTLGITIPTNSPTTTLSATATLATVTTLPTLIAPAFVPDGLGGGTFAVTLPAGVTDALLNIEDLGPAAPAGSTKQPPSCYLNGTTYPAYFTIHVTASGPYTLPDTDGVGSPTQRTPTICTAAQNAAVAGNVGTTPGGDQITIQLVGADYPLYGSNYLFNLGQQTPPIAGPAGNDITISPIVNQVST